MKPLFGGSVADSSRLYLLRSTRTLTAYSLLSEQSKREEVDDILMRSVELSDIIEHERENIPDNDDEDNVFIMSGISQERTLNRTAAHMPERFFHERYVTSDDNISFLVACQLQYPCHQLHHLELLHNVLLSLLQSIPHEEIFLSLFQHHQVLAILSLPYQHILSANSLLPRLHLYLKELNKLIS